MKIEISYGELLDVVNALRARASDFERMPTPLDPAQRDFWQREAANHLALADRILAQAAEQECGRDAYHARDC